MTNDNRSLAGFVANEVAEGIGSGTRDFFGPAVKVLGWLIKPRKRR